MYLIPNFGHYSFYIWICYGVSIAVILAFTVHTLRQNSKRPR